MKRMTFVITTALCASLLASGVALARAPHGTPIEFEQIDADGDGQISRAEMEGLRSRHLMEADANGDAVLSLEELQAQGSERAERRATRIMDRFDANEDGVLSEMELQGGKRMSRHFDRADQDSDGYISKAEFDEARDHRGRKRSKND